MAVTAPLRTFASKGHDLFATDARHALASTTIVPSIDRLWNRFVAAWFERRQGRSQARACCASIPTHAEIWIDASSLVAGIKMLLGFDPKEDYKGKVAKVDL